MRYAKALMPAGILMNARCRRRAEKSCVEKVEALRRSARSTLNEQIDRNAGDCQQHNCQRDHGSVPFHKRKLIFRCLAAQRATSSR